MIKPGQKIKVLCNGKNKKYYAQKGYVDDDIDHNVIIYVSPEDLPPGSHKRVIVICDQEDCHCEFDTSYCNYIRCHNDELGDFCTKHAYRKAQITNERLYGDKIVTRIEQFTNKAKETSMKRYGTIYPMQSEQVKQIFVTSFKNKYGVENPSHSPEIQQRRKATFNQRYGADNIFLLPEYQHKARLTMSANRVNGVMTSKPQQQLFDLLSNYYDNIDHDVEVDRYSLDIILNVDGCKIDIEYDGWYWHHTEEVITKDQIRQSALLNNYNIKTLRVKGGKNIPNIDVLNDKILHLVSGSDYEEIILPEWH